MKKENQPEILNALIESLAQASGGCSQLLHHKRDPHWMGLRSTIDLARDALVKTATFEAQKITMVKPA